MTALIELKFKCPMCNEAFQGKTLGSMGFRNPDEQLCYEYRGLNPMPYFLLVCPHCNYINWTSEFILLDEELDDSLLKAASSCELFEKFINTLIEQDAEPSLIAYASQQSGCCRKINGKDPTEQFKRAAEYFRKAATSGITELGGLSIKEWMKRMEDYENK